MGAVGGAVEAMMVGKWKPLALEDDTTSAPRGLWSGLQDGLTTMTSGFAAANSLKNNARPATPASATFDPATAGSVGDGSFNAPAGRERPGAPEPGKGAVIPPGLVEGNSVFRYQADGTPSNFTLLDQGQTNGCGTTSLAMVLNYMAGGKPLFDRTKVDARIRAYNMFTSPGDVAAFAEHEGMQASIHTNSTIADLHAMVDQGLPVEVLLDVSAKHDGTGLHYEVVTGYGQGKDGKPYIELANPWGVREYMPEQAFMTRWRGLGLHGCSIGLDQVAIVMKPKGNPAKLLSDDRGSFLDAGMSALRAAQGFSQVTSGFQRREASTYVPGAVRGVLGTVTGLVAMAGHTGVYGSKKLLEAGSEKFAQGGLGYVTGGACYVGGGLGYVVSRPVEAVGSAANRASDLLASGLHETMKRL